MPQLSSSQIIDLTTATLRDLGEPKFQQIAQELQEYEVIGKWLKREKMEFGSGFGIQRNLMGKLSRQAAHVGLMDTESVDIPDLLDQIQVPWVHARTKWGFIYQTDILMNRGKSLITNVLKPRRADAMISLAEELEAKAWSSPSVSNTLDPWGLPYWVVYNGSTGFNGGAPSGHTTVGNVNLTETPNFKNYTANYATVSKGDLIKKMKTGCRKTKWKSPVGIPDFTRGVGSRYRIYTDNERIEAFEEVGEAQNENLGRDLAPYGAARDVKDVNETLVFRKHPIIWVPQLDDTSVFTACTAPVYAIDHGTFYPVVLKGDYLREQEPEKVPNTSNVFRVFIDLTYNYLCVDRRRNSVYATA